MGGRRRIYLHKNTTYSTRD